MKYILLIISVVICCLTAGGQSSYAKLITETRTLLSRSKKEDTTHCLLLVKLAGLYVSTDSLTLSLQAIEEAKKIAGNLGFQKGLALAISETGTVYQVLKHDNASAIIYYQQAVHIAEENKIYGEIYILHSRLLNLYFYFENYPDAMTVVTSGLRIFNSLHDKRKEAKYESLAGYIYLKQNDIARSKQYYELYLQTSESLGDSTMLADAYCCIADVNVLKKDYPAALASLEMSLAIYIQQKNIERVAYLYWELGQTYLLTGNYPKALDCLLKTFEQLQKTRHNQYDLARYYITIGNIYTKLGKYEQAAIHLHKGLLIAKDIVHRENIRNGYEYLSENFVKQKKYDSAFFYSVLFNNLKDSIINERTAKEVEQVHTAFEVEKKNKEILFLNQQQRADLVEINKQQIQRTLLIIFSILVIIIAILAYSRQRLRQQKNLQVQLNRQRNEMFNIATIAQDQERKRIAEDIHDSLGSILSAAKLQLSYVEPGSSALNESLAARHKSILQLLDEASAEVRNISHHLMPATLSRMGLLAALESLFDKLTISDHFQVNFISHGFVRRLPEEMEISIYRIVLETVNNIIRHAKATQAIVQLVKHKEYISLVIEDNGIGFNYEKEISGTKGIGLQSILSRVSFLNGTVHIDTDPGKGTSVIIELPC